jgi:hypothetical protein
MLFARPLDYTGLCSYTPPTNYTELYSFVWQTEWCRRFEEVAKMYGKLVGIAEWFVGVVREVNRGIAVGRLRGETRARVDRQKRSDGSLCVRRSLGRG